MKSSGNPQQEKGPDCQSRLTINRGYLVVDSGFKTTAYAPENQVFLGIDRLNRILNPGIIIQNQT